MVNLFVHKLLHFQPTDELNFAKRSLLQVLHNSFRMIDLFAIFSHGGFVLWCFQATKQSLTLPINTLIKHSLLQVLLFLFTPFTASTQRCFDITFQLFSQLQFHLLNLTVNN